VYKFDKNGNLLWQRQPIGWHNSYGFASLVVDQRDGSVVATAEDAGAMVRLDADGNTIWTRPNLSPPEDNMTYSRNAIDPTENVVYVAGQTAGNLYKINLTNGDIIWTKYIGGVLETPTVDPFDKSIYVGKAYSREIVKVDKDSNILWGPLNLGYGTWYLETTTAEVFSLTNTNTECLADGPAYATVNVQPNTCITIEVIVDPNAFYLTGYNFGMQRFGFNYTGEITAISCYNDEGKQWAIELKENTQMDGFGTYSKVAYALKPEGQNRVEDLYIEICGTDVQIGTCFSAHIADFGIAPQTGNTCDQCINSAFFGSCPLIGTKKPAPTEPCQTLIELSSFIAKPGNGKVTLNWTTESEIDNAGFNIYRAASENGEYVKINDSLIASKAGAAQGASYQFIDSNVRNRKTYYYKLEDIDLRGNSTMHGPVSATPKWIFGIFGK
jgi:DNA-binding sugar fermentation-stimulating protein